MKKILGTIGLIGVLVLGKGAVWADGSVTVYNAGGSVIGSYTTIQEGVDVCPVGGTVSVAAGIYAEAIYINKRIALIGVETPTINPPNDGNAVTFDGTSTNGQEYPGLR